MLLLALDVSLRVTAAAAAVAFVLLAFRVKSGSLRHAAWSAVLFVMLTMPLLMAVVPEIEVPVPSTPALNFGTIASPAVERQPAAAANIPAATAPLASVAAERTIVTAERPSVNWPRLASAVYPIVASLLLLRIAGGWWLARRMVRTARPTSIENGHLVLESALVAAPVTIGVLRPVVLLPTAWREWPAFKLNAVLAHENAHITRRDPIVAFTAQVNRALFWFHPLAWWLERTIAVSAEHACDERAVGAAGDAGSYARVLLDFTEAVQARGGRVAWQGLGVDGTGLLGARIDRLLRGDAVGRMSVLRRVTTAAACAAVLIGAIACRQQVAATPLREDPEVAKRLARQAEEARKFQAAINLSLEQVESLEARLNANPEDWDARAQLVTYYSASRTVPWDRKLPGLRRHALWLIENAPEGPVAPPALSPEHDPDGFKDARRLWDRHLGTPDASPFLLYRAARFFWPHDKPTAEVLILRGRSIDPDGARLRASLPPNVGPFSWDAQLADLYASALLGHTNPMTRSEAEPAMTPAAQDVRRKLDASTDAELLARVAGYLGNSRAPKALELGHHYLDRALSLDSTSERARAVQARFEMRERQDRLTAAGDPSALTGADRLALLARKAQGHYMRLEYYDYRIRTGASDRDASGRPLDYRALIPEQETAARDAARQVLAAAEQGPEARDAGHAVFAAHHTLGLLALRNGDRDQAVRHLLDSTKVALPAEEHEPSLLWSRLSNYLLKEGERDSVIQFFESYAKINPRERDRLLADAQAVREGRMPQSYQTMLARP